MKNLNELIDTIELPEFLKTKEDFYSLIALRPAQRSSVIIYDKKEKKHKYKQIFRSYMSYFKTPEFDETIEKSYMFLNKSAEVPKDLPPYVDFAKSIDPRYNQMVVNFYSPEDFIESHRDCTAHMISKNSPILCKSLDENESKQDARHLVLEDVENKEEIINVPIYGKTCYVIKDNNSVRHSVTKGTANRVSITFRMMK